MFQLKGSPQTFSYQKATLPAHCCWLPESPTLLHRRGEGQGSQAFLGEDHPALGRGAVKQAHSGPFQPHPKHPHTILIRFMYGAVKQDFTGKDGSIAEDCNPLI